MSVTTLQNPATYSIVRTLADYDIQSSEPKPEDGEQQVAEPNPHPAPPTEGNPPGWEDNYRRVPPHRPINTELDFEYRNTMTNNVEVFFLFNMFGGIRIVQGLNLIWRATGGKINDTYFRFPVGGEY